jgi:hypothetical protein
MMRTRTTFVSLLWAVAAAALAAQQAGSATGKGVVGAVAFSPQYSYASTQTVAGQKFTWVVLTEVPPPVKAWAAAKDPTEPRQQWCEKEKKAFAALMLDPQWGINAYVTCANGAMKTEMVNSVNGLDSVVVTFACRDGGVAMSSHAATDRCRRSR